ncbi:MAG: class I SAM-dependent methyltransferase [Firmicutes bacterium]|nr:class I SAM-dependent methyltransferase [Bacillota bacterium]HOB34718.1 class I SAM-dependent methyltransferase [Bacillota bacterium]HPZ90244.1 class I SAM-dependent methyltransferase [Bacillota bacterium]HQE01634.1 class I SAM-dependent methyltransferase [Bacillota bacterium]
MDHYFSTEPNVPHDVRTIHYSPRDGVTLTFVTDAGVFSRQRVDYGSHVLISALPPLTGRILDLGCGYGPIGISLARLNPGARVLMVDTNRRAVALAQKNIRANGVANARALVSDGFAAVEGLFAAIVSNPPIRAGKKVIYPLFRQSRDFLTPGGSLWLVIQKKQGAASAVALLQEIFGNCTVTEKSRGYWVLRSTNKL